jgi:ADP-ribose pyrophosphatase YjhB (NUDIX family)
MAIANEDRYCAHCGHSLAANPRDGAAGAARACGNCGTIAYDGPRALVLSLVFAANKLLLIQRGQPPYQGKWAPPGGFVEHGECLEAAAAREVKEETGVELELEALIPYGWISLPKLNQIHALFMARLPEALPLRPALPEALDARWVLESEIAQLEFWDTGTRFDFALVYEYARSAKFPFFQRSESFARLFLEGSQAVYLRRRP